MIGEPQRTFYGNQFGNTFPVFVHFRIPLWVPEIGGPIDPDNEAHDLVMSVFGGMSKGERNRIKIRVRTRTRPRPRRDSGSTAWSPTLPQPPPWPGSSRCTSTA
ncbi:hypothetical protein ACIRQQ_01445 [Streptomyces fuscichromogenes]|uniref:hypothetical protein n=1 Tax=Streptomyces fuscichromogenes TaxID=1324013 RepID=UPI003809A972